MPRFRNIAFRTASHASVPRIRRHYCLAELLSWFAEKQYDRAEKVPRILWGIYSRKTAAPLKMLLANK